MQHGKQAGTDLTQNLPSRRAVFPNVAVLDVSPRYPEPDAGPDAGSKNRGLIMIRKLPIVALLIGACAITGQAEAHGGGWQGPAVFGAIVGSAIIGSALINQDRPVYVQQPVYAQPAPVYVQPPPPPVYYQPAPVYVQQPVYVPGPVYYGPPRGYYGHPHYGRW